MRTKSISALRRRDRRPGKPLRHGGALCAPSLGNMLTSGRYRLKSRQAACPQKTQRKNAPTGPGLGPVGAFDFCTKEKGGRAASGRPLVTSPAVQGRSRGRRISPQRKARRTLSGKSGFQRAGGSPQMSAPGCGRKGGRRPPSACTAGSPTLSQSLMNSRTSPMNTPPNQGNLKRGFLSLSHGGGAPSRGERAAWGLSAAGIRLLWTGPTWCLFQSVRYLEPDK